MRAGLLRSALALLWGAAALLHGVGSLTAAPPPDAEVEAAEAEQNRLLAEARRGGSLGSVVRTYESRLTRQPGPLNHYLLGRALFHAQDRPGALKAMLEVVRQEPDFWQAQVRIGSLYWLEKNAAAARQHLDAARRRAAEQPDVLRLAAEVGFGTKDYALAQRALERLVALEPEDAGLKAALAEVRAAQGDWEGAYRELRVLRVRDPRNLGLRLSYLEAAVRTRRFAEAAAEGEDLAGAKGEVADPRALRHTLDLLRQVYVETKAWQPLARVLERMLPWVKEEHREGLRETVAALRAGQVPGEAPPAPESAEDALTALLERALGPDPVRRREALQTFFGLGTGWVPRALLLRFHPAEEPDPECRAWVVRIVGSLADERVAKVAGHALQDPHPLVRRVAADALGEIGAQARLLDLLAHLDELPLSAAAAPEVVQEYNAVRGALVRLTGYDDLEIGAERWVAGAGLEASRQRWRAWLAGPAGVGRKVEAIRSLEATGETHPEWYLIVLVFVDPSLEVVRAAYAGLRARAELPGEDPRVSDARGRALWPRFPRAEPAALTPESLAPLRQQLKAWWTEWVGWRAQAGK